MSETSQPRKKRRSVCYPIARVLAFLLFNTIAPVRYHNKGGVEIDAPYILIANHQSWMDPVIMAKPVKRYEITFMGKKELVKSRVARAVLMDMHCIPVDRHNTDMMAMRACITALRNGEILGIFPEGTRHHKGLMEEMEGGVAMIALRSKVPMIPMYIPQKFRLFHRTDCYVGEPIPMDDLIEAGVNKDTCARLMQRITTTYAEMNTAICAK